MLPIVVIFISILFLAVYAYSTIGVVLNGGEVVYDEAKFQSYAVGEYYDYYNDTATKEDNIMLVFLTMEGYEKYFCIAITGDNLKTNVVSLFGNDTTPFGKAVLGSIGKNYQYSLDKNMAEAVEKMTANVGNLSLSSPYIKENDRSGALAPKLINHTELELTDETVNTALEEFATETGISMSIVVDTAENVFGKSIPWGGLVLIVAVVALIIFCIYYIVKKAKERKRIDEDLGGTGPIDPPIL